MKKYLIGALLAAVATPAFAGQHQATLTAEMTVVEECTISAADLTFGNIGILNKNYDSSSAITVICTPNLAYTVALQDAANPTATQFELSKGSDKIGFQTFQDSARTSAWNATALKSGTSLATGFGGNYTVYGRIPVQSSKPAGAYAAAMNAVVNF